MKQANVTTRTTKFYTILLTVVASVSISNAAAAQEALETFEEQFKKGNEALEKIFLDGNPEGLDKLAQVPLIQAPQGSTELDGKTARLINFVNSEFCKVKSVFSQYRSNVLVLIKHFREKCDINQLLNQTTQALHDLYNHAVQVGDQQVAQRAKNLINYIAQIKQKWSKSSNVTKITKLQQALK